MGWFTTPDNYEQQSTDELQALLKGLVYKIYLRQFATASDSDKYEKIIAELTRRKVEPISTLKPKD